MQIEIRRDDAEMLRDLLRRRVVELDIEISRTDSRAFKQKLRQLDLKKVPSISETLDWARALLALNAGELSEDLVNQTFNVILKYEGDIEKAKGHLTHIAQA